jgi:hypothetical protein
VTIQGKRYRLPQLFVVSLGTSFRLFFGIGLNIGDLELESRLCQAGGHEKSLILKSPKTTNPGCTASAPVATNTFRLADLGWPGTWERV